MDFFAWLRLLARNRAAVSWRYWHIAAIITVVSAIHTVLKWAEALVIGRRMARVPVQAPLFILGHWRTGTTLLHELMILGPHHAYPTTYECLEPNHFLLTEGLLTRWLPFLIPTRRPMDNMAAGWDRPQEDEFALCMMGQPSPYLTIAFPNHPPADPEYLDLEGVPPRALASWKRAFRGFIQRLALKGPRRLVLKSPTHTARIPVLLELFPEAQFIHIVRDPHVVFPSTLNLWRSLYRKHGLQVPSFQGLEEHVLATFERLYAQLERGKALLGPRQFCEVRYEELTAAPLAVLERIYLQLGLPGFEAARPQIEAYLARTAGYETNRYELTAEQGVLVGRRWAAVIERYGYGKAEGPAS